MAIVKYKNQSGVTYAYESESIWDPEKKQARPRRKYLGRVDDETGEIIPTNGRGRKKKEEGAGDSKSKGKSAENSALKKLEAENAKLKGRIEELEERVKLLKDEKSDIINNLKRLTATYE